MKYIIGAYSQIPYGASNEQYETLLENQIRPLLTLLYQNSIYKILFRLGINVFEWLENNHPEINMLILDLCKKGQVELLSSPDYDAILPIIPNHERSLYIEKTISYIRKKFSRRPKGFLNSYQIFNPSVISAINTCSIDDRTISILNFSCFVFLYSDKVHPVNNLITIYSVLLQLKCSLFSPLCLFH